jgi:hypothetical protein
MRRLRRASCDLSCMPVFILSIIGPYLTIGGAIHLNGHVVFQHLPYYPLLPLPSVKEPEGDYVDIEDKAAANIAHILCVLKRCLDNLAADHGALHPNILEVPTDVLQPSPHFKSFQYEEGEYDLIYRSHIDKSTLSGRSVFRADARRDGSTIPCMVKFAVRYGAEAHRIMVEARRGC